MMYSRSRGWVSGLPRSIAAMMADTVEVFSICGMLLNHEPPRGMQKVKAVLEFVLHGAVGFFWAKRARTMIWKVTRLSVACAREYWYPEVRIWRC